MRCIRASPSVYQSALLEVGDTIGRATPNACKHPVSTPAGFDSRIHPSDSIQNRV